LEQTPNIFYLLYRATTNEQIVPAVEYLLEEGYKSIYVLGSDHVFPRTSNTIIKEQVAALGDTVVGEEPPRN
jgi:urea transport system substrate-binding protein